MNRNIAIILLLLSLGTVAFGKKKTVLEPSYAWQMTYPLGLRTEATIDTLFEDYAQRFVPGAIYDATVATGNYGAQDWLFFSTFCPY